MPIYKYKSLEEAEHHLHELLPPDPLVRLQRVQALFAAFRPPKKIQRGIFRFKSLDEANQHRQPMS